MSSNRDDVAPDGSDVRVLLALERGSMAHFQLGPTRVSRAVAHKTVEEIWFVLGGAGEMWRKRGDQEAIVALESGICLTIPSGTQFQFRSAGPDPLAIIGVTMPPWPGEGEAYKASGTWQPN